MRQRSEVESDTVAPAPMQLADHAVELVHRHELRDRELAHRDHELRFEHRELRIEPRRTVRDFVGIGNAIAAGRTLSREAPAYRSHVDAAAESFFVEADAAEPFE